MTTKTATDNIQRWRRDRESVLEKWSKLASTDVKESSTSTNNRNQLIIQFPDWETKRSFVGDLENITWNHDDNQTHENYDYKHGTGLRFVLPEEGNKEYSESALFQWVLNNPHALAAYYEELIEEEAEGEKDFVSYAGD